MMAITLWQPWATLVAIGAKKWETRSWATKYTGPLAIHAAACAPKVPDGDDLFDEWLLWERFHAVLRGAGYRCPGAHRTDGAPLPRGVVVAVVNMVQCRPVDAVRDTIGVFERTFGNYTDGRWAWQLEDVRQVVPPIPYRGRQQLWRLPDEIMEAA